MKNKFRFFQLLIIFFCFITITSCKKLQNFQILVTKVQVTTFVNNRISLTLFSTAEIKNLIIDEKLDYELSTPIIKKVKDNRYYNYELFITATEELAITKLNCLINGQKFLLTIGELNFYQKEIIEEVFFEPGSKINKQFVKLAVCDNLPKTKKSIYLTNQHLSSISVNKIYLLDEFGGTNFVCNSSINELEPTKQIQIGTIYLNSTYAQYQNILILEYQFNNILFENYFQIV